MLCLERENAQIEYWRNINSIYKWIDGHLFWHMVQPKFNIPTHHPRYLIHWELVK